MSYAMSIRILREQEDATVVCRDRQEIKKLDSLCEQYPETYRCIDSDKVIEDDGMPASKTYAFPKWLLWITKPGERGRSAVTRHTLF